MSTNKINFDLSDIQKNAEILDSEALHLFLIEKVKSGEYETFLEALANYVETNDLDLDSPSMVKKYISPTLHGILYREAMQKSMLTEQAIKVSITDFFD